MADVYQQEKLAEAERLNPEKVLKNLREQGINAVRGGSASQIVEAILPRLQPGDIVLVMSNGGFGGIHRLLLDGLAETNLSRDSNGAVKKPVSSGQ